MRACTHFYVFALRYACLMTLLHQYRYGGKSIEEGSRAFPGMPGTGDTFSWIMSRVEIDDIKQVRVFIFRPCAMLLVFLYLMFLSIYSFRRCLLLRA